MHLIQTLYSHALLYQNELLNNGSPEWFRFLPFRSTIWRFLILARAWYWVLLHAVYVPFTGRDLSTRLKKLDPRWREVIVTFREIFYAFIWDFRHGLIFFKLFISTFDILQSAVKIIILPARL